MGLLERVRAAFARSLKAQSSYASTTSAGGVLTNTRNILLREQRRSAKLLRGWAERNEFVRVAINRRKRQIGMAKWQIIRIDDPKQNPNPSVESAVRDLFNTVNPKGESFRALLDQVIEDMLVLDAGVIWKRKTLGGGIHSLYAVDGATIRPDPNWDGEEPNAIRYRQIIDGVQVAEFKNDEMLYVMANPRTHSPIGWSPVETLMQAIEAELFSEQYDFRAMQQYAPEGFLYIGDCTDTQREAFASYYRTEIAGEDQLGLLNGKVKPEFIATKHDTYETRQQYKKWLATKIAAVFEMDLLVFNLSESVHKSVGNNLMARTDEGANALATLVSEYITREIIWEIDPAHKHGFQFDDLNARDELAQAKIDQIQMSIGVTFPNEIRAREGLDPVEWGEEPYTATQSQFAGDEPDSGDQQDSSQNPDGSEQGEGARKSIAPFVGAAPTRSGSLAWLGSSSASASPKRSASARPTTSTRSAS